RPDLRRSPDGDSYSSAVVSREPSGGVSIGPWVQDGSSGRRGSCSNRGGLPGPVEEPGRHRPFALDLDLAARREGELSAEASVEAFGDLDPPADTAGFHAAGGIDRVAPEVVHELLASDHAGDSVPGVHANPHAQRE